MTDLDERLVRAGEVLDGARRVRMADVGVERRAIRRGSGRADLDRRVAGARRARVAMALAAVALVVLGIVGIASRRHEPADRPPPTPTGVPVPLVISLPGVSPGRMTVSDAAVPSSGYTQVFRRSARDFEGPMLWIREADDDQSSDERVDIGGPEAFIGESGPDQLSLGIGFEDDDAVLTSLGLTRDELVAVARGIRPRQGGGFIVGTLPEGLRSVYDGRFPSPAQFGIVYGGGGYAVNLWQHFSAGPMMEQALLTHAGCSDGKLQMANLAVRGAEGVLVTCTREQTTLGGPVTVRLRTAIWSEGSSTFVLHALQTPDDRSVEELLDSLVEIPMSEFEAMMAATDGFIPRSTTTAAPPATVGATLPPLDPSTVPLFIESPELTFQEGSVPIPQLRQGPDQAEFRVPGAISAPIISIRRGALGSEGELLDVDGRAVRLTTWPTGVAVMRVEVEPGIVATVFALGVSRADLLAVARNLEVGAGSSFELRSPPASMVQTASGPGVNSANGIRLVYDGGAGVGQVELRQFTDVEVDHAVGSSLLCFAGDFPGATITLTRQTVRGVPGTLIECEADRSTTGDGSAPVRTETLVWRESGSVFLLRMLGVLGEQRLSVLDLAGSLREIPLDVYSALLIDV